MLTTVLPALGGAAGVGALITPLLVHLAARRSDAQELIDQLQQERDTAVIRAHERDETVTALWDYALRLRYWFVKDGCGTPPTMPEGLSVAAVRARLDLAP